MKLKLKATCPAPSITRLGEGEESLGVESLDMDKSGKQGQVLVSKGMAGRSVSKLHPAATKKRRVTRPQAPDATPAPAPHIVCPKD